MADEEYEAEDAGADYDDIAEEDDNIEETEEQEEDGFNTQCVAPGQAGGGVEKSKRITTRYMTKYERARVLGTVFITNIEDHTLLIWLLFTMISGIFLSNTIF